MGRVSSRSTRDTVAEIARADLGEDPLTVAGAR